MGASGPTIRGQYLVWDAYLRKDTAPTPPATLYMALCRRKNPKLLSASAATNEGSGRVGIPVATHGYATGALIVIEGTVNYDGAYLVQSTSGTNKVVIVATYVAETFTGAEMIHEQPGPATQTMADVVEITPGNGYVTGGLAVAMDDTDVPTMTEVPTSYPPRVYFRLINEAFAAAGGQLPVSGLGARYAVYTTNEVTIADRQILYYWDLEFDRIVTAPSNINVLAAEQQFVPDQA